jgi:D-xylose transport system permease protein
MATLETPTSPEPGKAPDPSSPGGTSVGSTEVSLDLAVQSPELSGSLGEYIRASAKRIRGGESGVLPVFGGLIVLVIVFQTQSSSFLSTINFSNLLVQGAPLVLLGMAEVWVLILGEIDLSAGYVAAIGAVVTAILASPPDNFPWWLAIIGGIAATSTIGLINGTLVIRLKIPSFVVTLAGFLFWQGVLLYLVNSHGTGGTIRISSTVLLDISNGTLSPAAGWVMLVVAVGLFAALILLGDRKRRSNGLVTPPLAIAIIKIVVAAAAGAALVYVSNINRATFGTLQGVPMPVPIILGFVVLYTFMLGRTRFGRYQYAIGGNAEAARRGGVSLGWNRLWAFVLTGATAGSAGILLASRLGSVSNNFDGGTLVLDAVAAAVIGGASLFGGRGKMVHALLGGLVIAVIANGMGLIGLAADYQYMVTGLVLLAAVTIDSLARRGRTAS